jgi:hypothetical protein
MSRTPEGVVKTMISRRLKAAGFCPPGQPISGDAWYWMPVQGALGTVHGIPDYCGCYFGKFWGIEAKPKTGKATQNQLDRHREIRNAGGFVMIVRNEDDMDTFFEMLEEHVCGREPV